MIAPWKALTAHLGELETLEGAAAVLGWDQSTYQPPKASAARGEQLALLGRLAHERVVDPRVGEWLEALAASPDEPGRVHLASGLPFDEVRRATVRNLRRRRDRAVRVPAALVSALARAQSDGFAIWAHAKAANDFGSFAPILGTLVALTRERAAAIDANKPVYDVLLDEFDPGVSAASLGPMFERLGAGLVGMVGELAARPAVPKLDATVPIPVQRAIHHRVLGALGYDLDGGRLDDAEHPFSVGIHPTDVRITTHLYENDLLWGLGGTIHECGHALYEQGLPVGLRGTGLCAAASTGLHESQSRLWENFVGRSRPFCGWFAGVLAEHLGDDAPSEDTLWRANHRVDRGLVRVAADEVTYNLHVAVRFRLETALMSGDLAIRDLPGAWDDAYEAMLGLRPPDAARGVLQDVHWAAGMFGYFPGYTLGNLYAAALWGALRRDLPQVDDAIRVGEFGGIRAWLREKVHAVGAVKDASDIVRDAAGETDLVAGLLQDLAERYGRANGIVLRGG